MTKRAITIRPTDAELELLRVLWKEGPSTVREIHEKLPGGSRVGYTTVLKLLQIMWDKGIVARDESARAHVYRAAAAEDAMQSHLVRDLVSRAFDGSTSRLVLRALSSRSASAKELAEIRQLLDRIDGGRK